MKKKFIFIGIIWLLFIAWSSYSYISFRAEGGEATIPDWAHPTEVDKFTNKLHYEQSNKNSFLSLTKHTAFLLNKADKTIDGFDGVKKDCGGCKITQFLPDSYGRVTINHNQYSSNDCSITAPKGTEIQKSGDYCWIESKYYMLDESQYNVIYGFFLAFLLTIIAAFTKRYLLWTVIIFLVNIPLWIYIALVSGIASIHGIG